MTIILKQSKLICSKCNTEFGKRNPINAGIWLAMKFNIDVYLFTIFKSYKKIINEIIKLMN